MNKMELSNQALSLRRKLGEDDLSPVDIFSLILSIEKLTLVFYPLGFNISGACIKGQSSAIIAINSDMSLGRQRFSMAHELYHLMIDSGFSSVVCSRKLGKENEIEKRADQFASYFLMPPAALYEAVQRYKKPEDPSLSLQDIIRLEQYFGISHQAMLIRLQEEYAITAEQASAMQRGVISTAARLGMDVTLYKSCEENKKRRVYGYYITQVERLFQKNKISIGKQEELLLDAFRDDLVYGEIDEGGDLID